MSKILVIDDDKLILEGIKINLEAEGFEVLTAINGRDAISLFEKEKPQLALIDIMLPDISGFEILTKIKKIDPGIIGIFLTARNEIYDKISGFTMGADDYITKPFDIRELILRIKARLKINETMELKDNKLKTTEFGDVKIIHHEYKVLKNKINQNFTRTEFELLDFLLINKGIVLTREQVFERIWGNDSDFSSRTVDMHISRIRKKIEVDHKTPEFIETVYGIGYIFKIK